MSARIERDLDTLRHGGTVVFRDSIVGTIIVGLLSIAILIVPVVAMMVVGRDGAQLWGLGLLLLWGVGLGVTIVPRLRVRRRLVLTRGSLAVERRRRGAWIRECDRAWDGLRGFHAMQGADKVPGVAPMIFVVLGGDPIPTSRYVPPKRAARTLNAAHREFGGSFARPEWTY